MHVKWIAAICLKICKRRLLSPIQQKKDLSNFSLQLLSSGVANGSVIVEKARAQSDGRMWDFDYQRYDVIKRKRDQQIDLRQNYCIFLSSV